MSNHWHFVVWPRRGQHEQVSDFFRWLTVTHAQRWHAHHGTSGMGHVYQGRFKSFPVESDEHLRTVLRYVRAQSAACQNWCGAEQWRWGSLWRRTSGDANARALLSDPPSGLPKDWTRYVNRAETEAELTGPSKACRVPARLASPPGKPRLRGSWTCSTHSVRPAARSKIHRQTTTPVPFDSPL